MELNKDRRQLLQAASSFAGLGFLEPFELLFNRIKIKRRLSLRAFRSVKTEGAWPLTQIDGKVPEELSGTLYRIGPGQKETFGTKLKHFFDGDGYLSAFSFSNGQINLKSRFIDTIERRNEALTRSMNFHEFGTRSPSKNPLGYKNPPNINLIPWQNNLLALTESSLPSLVSKSDFSSTRLWHFNYQLPKNMTFTAHPKIDPRTGEIYAFGVTQGLPLAINIIRMNPQTGRVKIISSILQDGVYLTHDMMITENFIIVVVPPTSFRVADLALSRAPLTDSVSFDSEASTRIYIIPKSKPDNYIMISYRGEMVFHHGNAYEENGKIIFDTFAARDASIFDYMSNYRNPKVDDVHLPSLVRYQIDLVQRAIIRRQVLFDNCDFPAINPSYLGNRNNYCYFVKIGPPEDILGFTHIVKYNFLTRKSVSVKMPPNEVCGEPIFVAKNNAISEDDGWVLFLGYNDSFDKTFLEIRNASDMNFVARAWAPHYFPLGFHGCFEQADS